MCQNATFFPFPHPPCHRGRRTHALFTHAGEGVPPAAREGGPGGSPGALQMITKALERQFSSFTQVVLTMSPFLQLDRERDPIGYLKQFHQNTDVKTDLLDVRNLIGDVSENYTVYRNNDNTEFMFTCIYEAATGKIIADNKEQLKSVIAHLKLDKLNDKFRPKKETIYKFANESLNHYYNNKQIVREGADELEAARHAFNHYQRDPYAYGSDVTLRSRLDAAKTISDLQKDMDEATRKDSQYTLQAMQYQNQINQQTQAQNNWEKDSKFKSDQFEENKKMNNHKIDIDKQRLEMEKNKRPSLKDLDVKLNEKVLTDNDVKKANELIPTTLHIRVKVVSKQGEDAGFLDFMIGVKATMHPIKSDEMIINIVNACKNNNKFFDFLRWTSGEISFFKDFLFNINEIKDDVMNRSAGASNWWITLKRRKALSKIKNGFMRNQILPNATLVISMEEVEYIKSEYGYDLMNTTFIDKIMQTYFLLGFVVVDNSTQIAHFMFDGQQNYQSVTFSGLEKENSSDEKKFKEMLKVINRN
jgi:hypothetical protein